MHVILCDDDDDDDVYFYFYFCSGWCCLLILVDCRSDRGWHNCDSVVVIGLPNVDRRSPGRIGTSIGEHPFDDNSSVVLSTVNTSYLFFGAHYVLK